MKRIGFYFGAVIFSMFGLTACGGGGEEQEEAALQVQQEPTQQTAQTTSSPARSSDELAGRLIGTWEATSIAGNSVSAGTQRLTFSEDGTLRFSSDVRPDPPFTGQYSVLDDSHIRLTGPDETSHVANYSLDGDTLTMTDPKGEPARYRRTG